SPRASMAWRIWSAGTSCHLSSLPIACPIARTLSCCVNECGAGQHVRFPSVNRVEESSRRHGRNVPLVNGRGLGLAVRAADLIPSLNLRDPRLRVGRVVGGSQKRPFEARVLHGVLDGLEFVRESSKSSAIL